MKYIKAYLAQSERDRQTEEDTETQSKLSDISHKDIIKKDLFIHKQYTTLTYSHILVYYIISIYILIKKNANTILFFTHIYGNYIAWSFEVKKSKDEW